MAGSDGGDCRAVVDDYDGGRLSRLMFHIAHVHD